MNLSHLATTAAALALVAGCTSIASPPDGGGNDAASRPDLPGFDAGVTDLGVTPDAGGHDDAGSDAGATDAGADACHVDVATECAGRCGTITSTTCGVALDCGNPCTGVDSCGGGGTANVCGCTPDPDPCGTQVCGPTTDSCGNPVSCGPCGGRCCFDSCVCSSCGCP
jgi:hypothetical protein